MIVTAVKTIKFDDIMKVMKKYVATSQTRPVLTMVYFDGTHFVATNSHHLIRVNAEVVTDIPEHLTQTFLYNTKENVIPNVDWKYPDTSRLIPNSSNSTVQINNNIKDFIEHVKAAKKSLVKKEGHVSLDFAYNDLTIRTVEKVIENKKYIKWDYLNENKLNNITVEGEELTVKTSEKYLLTALEAVKKLSKLSNEPVKLDMTGHLRPLHFNQNGVFDIMVLPIRVY